jgi:hypothetical protein
LGLDANTSIVDASGNVATAKASIAQFNSLAPAGTSGEAINLALAGIAAADHAGAVTLNVAGLPAGWVLSEGVHNVDGSWTVTTNDVSSLAVTSPDGFTGALLLQVTETWTNADGSTGTAYVSDNVEAFAHGAPIFAWSGDDTLTASSGNDTLVFANTIGNDVVHSFDTAHDKVDLVGFTGFSTFADVQSHLATDAAGNAVLTLGNGQTITFDGVNAGALTAADFVFDQTPVTHNAGDMVLGDGTMLPLSGVVDNTGTIHLAASGTETDLEIIQHGVTLQGGGTVVLSDNMDNVIFGSSADVTLTNVDNTITGAGHIGDGQLTLVNESMIVATGANALVIDTGASAVDNSGTLEALGAGGLSVLGDVVNQGLLWANGSDLSVGGAITGSGSALISGNGVLELGGAFSEEVKFDDSAAGKLVLDHAADFHGLISGFTSNDTLDIEGLLTQASTLNYNENAQGTGGVLTVTDGSTTANIALSGHYAAADFHLDTTSIANHVLVHIEEQSHAIAAVA